MTPRLAPYGPQVLGQGAGVDLADADDPGLDEIAVQLARGAPGGRRQRHLAHDEARDLRARRLDVLAVDAVVPDVRVGHRDDLARVGGIGQDLLVAGQRRVEDDLARCLALPAEGSALEDPPVLERQHRLATRSRIALRSTFLVAPTAAGILPQARRLALHQDRAAEPRSSDDARPRGAARSGRRPRRRCSFSGTSPQVRLSLLPLR